MMDKKQTTTTVLTFEEVGIKRAIARLVQSEHGLGPDDKNIVFGRTGTNATVTIVENSNP